MRAANIGVRKLCYTECDNCKKCKQKWPPIMFKNIWIVFIFEIVFIVLYELVYHGVPHVVKGQQDHHNKRNRTRIVKQMTIIVFYRFVMEQNLRWDIGSRCCHGLEAHVSLPHLILFIYHLNYYVSNLIWPYLFGNCTSNLLLWIF